MTSPYPPVCANPDHNPSRPPKAFARLTWPEGPYTPTLACKTCTRWSVADALGDYGRPILVSPIPIQNDHEVSS